MHLLVDSSAESEAVATGKLGEAIAYAREIFRGLGIPCSGPTPCWTDNKANQLLSSGEGSPTRMRHAIRRFNVFKQRVFCDHNSRLPRIAFFATRDIAPFEELCYDYGYADVPGKTMPCLCGAANCKKLLY